MGQAVVKGLHIQEAPMSGFESLTRTKLGFAAVGLLAVGGVAGGMVGHHMHPPIAMAPLHPVAIKSLASSQGIVAIKGRVAEVFGSRLVVDDGTGRTLVDAGPRGDDLAAVGSVVTVQGRFDREAFRPDFLVDPSGNVFPVRGPRGGHRGPHERRGPDDDGPRGPDGPMAPPPPPPAAG
jgi:hypothetical protein